MKLSVDPTVLVVIDDNVPDDVDPLRTAIREMWGSFTKAQRERLVSLLAEESVRLRDETDA